MRTTLKRGIGRSTAVNGNGHSVLPPTILSTVNRYQQPHVQRTLWRRAGRFFLWLGVVLSSLALASAAGAYLYFHESIAAIGAHSKDVKLASKHLDIPLPHEPVTALILGSDARLINGKWVVNGGSDTIILLRADPITQSISMLSIPRDYNATIWCKGQIIGQGKVNSAYARCNSEGSLETVKHLTGLPINYLVTVNLRGFKKIVDEVGGVWIDVDHRYYNHNNGSAATNYADIDLQPGYQKLDGTQALAYVRFRHTDSDLVRNIRQQAFIKALKQQISTHLSVFTMLRVVGAITHNVEVGSPTNGGSLESAVRSWALFAYGLPPGRFFQTKIQNVTGYSLLTASQTDLANAIQQFTTPDVQSSQKAVAVTFGRKAAGLTAPPPSSVTVNVLNGNGVIGSATNAGFALAQHGYKLIVPSNPADRNAPTFDYFRTKVYYDRTQAKAHAGALAIAKLIGDSDVEQLPAELVGQAQGSMVTVVVGSTFKGTIAPVPVDQTPKKAPPTIRTDPSQSLTLLRQERRHVPFRLMVPTVIDNSSYIDTTTPIRVYDINGTDRALRLTFYDRAHLDGYWGVEETRWTGAPALQQPTVVRRIAGREYDLFYNGPHLHMAVLRWRGTTYWIVNTLDDSLSNETMLAIAKGLQPLR